MNNVANLGKSFKHPLTPTSRGQVEKVGGTDSINQSIHQILSTPLGSAFYQEDRGSLLYTLTHEQNDAVLRSLLDFHIVEALNQWENRIEIKDVMYYQDEEHLLNCRIIYTVKATGLEDSYIYPFNREIDR